MSDKRIIPFADGVIAENGPMHLTIRASRHGEARLDMAGRAGEYAFTCLAQVAANLKLLKRRHDTFPKGAIDAIAARMIQSVLATGVDDLTPMAAVAGAIADAVADWLVQAGMTRIIVDNGGDIAIRLSGKESSRVGLRTDIRTPDISHVVELTARSPSWGVNTSGLGGRSLTRGIASGVTAFARTSAVADACATAIANACYAKDRAIVRVPAETLDRHTDIPGMLVTADIGELLPETVAAALGAGLAAAQELHRKGLIRGALVAVGGTVALTDGFREQVGPLFCRSQATPRLNRNEASTVTHRTGN